MVKDMVEQAKTQRRRRSLTALVVVGLIGIFVFSDAGTCVLGGLGAFIGTWFFESFNVYRVTQIEQPWRK
jgi:uncharacterized membrane protein YeaQ/YmgE (transglycosylase-associated protein family)